MPASSAPPAREAGATSAAAERHYHQQVRLRRRKALELLLASTAFCGFVLAVLVLWINALPGSPPRITHSLANATVLTFIAAAASFVAVRLISTEAGSALLLVAGVVIISISDEPSRLILGPALMAYSVPILAAGILLPPWSAFLFAGLSGLVVSLIGFGSVSILHFASAILIFFMLAFITWYFAFSLERMNRALSRANASLSEDIIARKEAEDAQRNVNAELERRVNERTAELLRANVELQQSARLKDEFLATMSHELRTPLTGVLGAADVLGEEVHGPLNPRQHAAVRMIRESGKQLLDLINSILDLSRIEAGGMELSMETLSADKVCTAALAVVHRQAADKNLTVGYSAAPSGLTLMADPLRLKQILVNLLSNAVKFTPEGGKIGLEVIGDAANEQVRFVVWDTGIGIAPEQHGRLFEPFIQLDRGLNRQYGGAGLGLALVHRFAELHGGGVALESSPGEGSRFTLALPWRPASPAASAPSTTPTVGEAALRRLSEQLGRKPLILLAEDNRTSIEIVLNYLEPLGCDLIVVLRGDEAVRAAGERRPDLVLMDIRLPYLDGIAAIRQIRAHPDPKIAGTPILAVTALAMQGHRERCLTAGADDYLSKPFTLRALVDRIVRLIEPAATL